MKPVCADILTARKLIAQMKEDRQGRYVSNLDVDHQSPCYSVPDPGEPCLKGEPVRFQTERHEPRICERLEDCRGEAQFRNDVERYASLDALLVNVYRNSVGRCGNGHIRTRLEDCEVGDCVPLEQTTFKEGNFVRLQERSVPMRLFHRFTVPMTRDMGRTWKDELFWKRVA